MSARVAVAATGAQSLAAGLGVADEGGNAIDAALAAAFVALATEPGLVSFGGGAFINIWPAESEPVVIDGNVEMPGRGLPRDRFGAGVREIWTDYGGGVLMHAGHGTAATPGCVPALARAHADYAKLSWPRLLEPAIFAARDGYPMGAAGARYLNFVADSLFGDDPEAHRLVTRGDGSLIEPGEITANPLLADTLIALANEGPSLFTVGEVARRLAEQMEHESGLITAADLAEYQTVVRRPHVMTAGEWQVAINPPPAIGGPMLAIMLGELQRRGAWDWRDVIEVQQTTLAYRLGVHDFSADLLGDGERLLAAVAEHGLDPLRSSSATVHVSSADSEGNVCAVTMSSGYGAGMCIPGTGILLNNCLGEVELNRRGLHALSPGTRLASNMAPTTARRSDGPTLAIGSPGADRITTALMLVLGHACLEDLPVTEAITLPRLHVRSREGGFRVEHEPDAAIAAAAGELGLPTHEYDGPHMYFGGVGAAGLGHDGQVHAAGDSRREAAVGVA